MEAALADPGFLIFFAAVLVATGLFAGLLAGLFGVGGGIVVVPVLFNTLPWIGVPGALAMHLAVGTSLAVMVPTALSSIRAHHRRGAVDWSLLKVWGPAVVAGAALGAYFGGRASADFLTGLFATVALLVAVHMTLAKESWRLRETLPGEPVRAGLGAGIGLISVMMGIGGGTMSVPALTLCGYPIRKAVGTAAAIGLLIALPGALGFLWSGLGARGLPPFSLGYVSLIGLALVTPATILAAPWGATLAHSLSARVLRRLFALFLIVTAARMLWSLLA